MCLAFSSNGLQQSELSARLCVNEPHIKRKHKVLASTTLCCPFAGCLFAGLGPFKSTEHSTPRPPSSTIHDPKLQQRGRASHSAQPIDSTGLAIWCVRKLEWNAVEQLYPESAQLFAVHTATIPVNRRTVSITWDCVYVKRAALLLNQYKKHGSFFVWCAYVHAFIDWVWRTQTCAGTKTCEQWDVARERPRFKMYWRTNTLLVCCLKLSKIKILWHLHIALPPTCS